MCGEEHRAVLGQFREEPVEADPLLGIEAGGGLVDNDQLRIAGERLRDPEPLLHTAGVPFHLALCGVGQVDPLQQLGRELLQPLGSLHTLEHQQVAQHRLAAQVRVEAEVLGQVAELAANAAGIGDDVLAVERDSPGGGLQQPRDDAHQRGLAGAVGAEKAEHSLRNIQRDAL